ncbi:zinc finger protein 260 isoform X2 [Bicyclus anynana]|uniref:Zinc finger protein 260 isoform X2 n=1 Tax=Bicyclus anynana TaxID=110368 RepID=A0ABM3LY77_BICAN|nr:zinc finger protein 260 isoform X2 [Bicyclus anynana]
MRCCVPFCKNTSDNVSTSERNGITFHALPSEGNLRTAWLRALGTQDHHLPDPAVVCSQHFLEDDFCTTERCVRQINSHAIPSTVQMCMICLDSDSKLFLMSKHKLEEAYQQLTGLSLCGGTNLKQTLCVLCAQRLINFSRFRDLCLRAHSLMTDLLEQDEFITIQHKELMNCATKHLRCNLTRTTLRADCCDLYIDHTDEEAQTAAEESVVGDVATLVKREDSSDSMSNADNSELVHEDDTQRDNSNNECVSEDKYSGMSIKLEPMLVVEAICEAPVFCSTVTERVAKTESTVVYIKSESTVFGCTLCYEDFVQEDAYNEHMNMHLQNGACDASQVCEPRAAVSRSGDSLVLQNKTGSQRLNDTPPAAAGCAQATVAPLSARLAANDYKVQATEEAAATWKSEQILETDIGEENQLSQSNTKISAKPYSCDTCNYKTGNKCHLLTHKRKHTGEKPYCCEICNCKFARDQELKRHRIIHTGEKPYACETCSYTTTDKSNLLTHKRTHTGEMLYCCETCDYKFARECDLKRHERTHTGEKPYSCDTCNFKTAQKSYLIKHKRSHTGEKPYSCDSCNFKTAQKSYLIKHKRSHTGEKPYACEICNYKTPWKSYLLIHKRNHAGDKPYSCDMCNYKTAEKGQLICHMKTHTGEKPYSCDICKYKCLRKRDLERHKRTHTGPRPYSCEMCNYKTGNQSNLLTHKIKHTREKPYCCEICDCKFARDQDLKRHTRTHTGEKPYSCETCSYKTANKSDLKRHKRTHTGENPLS